MTFGSRFLFSVKSNETIQTTKKLLCISLLCANLLSQSLVSRSVIMGK